MKLRKVKSKRWIDFYMLWEFRMWEAKLPASRR